MWSVGTVSDRTQIKYYIALYRDLRICDRQFAMPRGFLCQHSLRFQGWFSSWRRAFVPGRLYAISILDDR